MIQIFAVLGPLFMIPTMALFMMPVRKSAESGKLMNPQTGKVYSYNPKHIAYILLSLSIAFFVSFFVLARHEKMI